MGRQSWGALAWPWWFQSLPMWRLGGDIDFHYKESWCGCFPKIHGSLEKVLTPGKDLLAPKRDRKSLRHISSAENESVSEKPGDACTCDQANAVWKLNPVLEIGISTKNWCIIYPPHSNTCISVDFSFKWANVQLFSTCCAFPGSVYVLFVFQSLICTPYMNPKNSGQVNSLHTHCQGKELQHLPRATR